MTQAVQNLKASIDRQDQKLDRIDDLRVDMVRSETRLSAACDELQRVKTKLDRVHNWIIGVGAVIGFLVFASQVVLRVWPGFSQTPTASVPSVK